MRIHLWKGHHSEQLLALMGAVWEREELLVVCPPLLEDLSFVSLLPEGPLEFVGAWEREQSLLEEVARRPRHPAPYPRAPVYGVFTSGTVSGTPRLVLYSKENIESSLGGILRLFDAGRIRTVFCYPQPFHTFGLLLGYRLSLQLGARLVCAPGRYSRAAHELRLAVKDPDTLTLGTPTHFQDLLRLVRETGQAPAASYSCIIGGAPVPAALWRSAREELRVEAPSIGYGCTEASPGLTHLPPGRMPLEDAELGFPLEGVEPRPPTPEGLEFSGPSVCLAILHAGQVEFPRRVLVRDDVRVREDGVWMFRGRCDLVLNRGGEKFSLEHLERLIATHTGLEAVCVSTPHERLGEDLGVLLRTAEASDVARLVECLRDKAHLRLDPAQILRVREFPLNAAAKLDRRTSAQWSRSHRAPEGGEVLLRGSGLTLDEVARVAGGGRMAISGEPEVEERVTRAYECMQRAVAANEVIYGVTTGLGGMAHVLISPEEREELQDNMLWYHKAGAGRRLPTADVRAAMLLRANSHLRGASGLRMALIRRLETFLNAGVTPHVPELGSIGASGDLVPLTYITGALVGHAAGFRVEFQGRDMDATEALALLGLEPLRLHPKEALAMLNGTSVLTGIAANCVHEARRLLALALHAHALLFQGLRATTLSFHPFIHAHKPHPGQVWSAARMLALLEGSQLIREAPGGPGRNPEAGLVQDRYSLRCLPQYLGPIVDGLAEVARQVEVEMNSASDNPLVDARGEGIYYGGNFLGQYIGTGMDRLRYLLGLLAKHLDVQLAMVVAPEFNNGLPPSLVGNPERRVNMGLKGLQLCANSIMPLITFYGNSLADRFPTHAEQFNQNINSQGFGSANLTRQSLELLRQLVSISLLFGVQAVDLRTHAIFGHYDARRTLSPATLPLYLALREVTGTPPSAERPWLWNDNQRVLDADLAAVSADLARNGAIARATAPP